MLQMEANVKKELMDHEFEINMKLKKMDVENNRQQTQTREDRQDQRVMMSGQQQEKLVEKRAMKEKPFESAGNDVVGGGMRLSAFEPK
jgi:hypothetical protein